MKGKERVTTMTPPKIHNLREICIDEDDVDVDVDDVLSSRDDVVYPFSNAVLASTSPWL